MKIPGHTAVGSKTLRRPHEGPWAWLAAASVALSVLMLGALIVLLSVKGLANFWPSTLHEVTLDDGDTVIGVPFEQRTLPGGEGVERRYWIANRDDGGGFLTEERVRSVFALATAATRLGVLESISSKYSNKMKCTR